MTDDRIIAAIDAALADTGDDDGYHWHDAARWSPDDGWDAEPDDPLHAHHYCWDAGDDTDLIDMTTVSAAPIVRGTRRPKLPPVVTLSGECDGRPLLWVQPSRLGTAGYWTGSVELVAAASVLQGRLSDPHDVRALASVVMRLCGEVDDATGVLGLTYEMENGR
ncbi:MAG: hypothetical protein WAV90_00430 [Gordonia amarae]